MKNAAKMVGQMKAVIKEAHEVHILLTRSAPKWSQISDCTWLYFIWFILNLCKIILKLIYIKYLKKLKENGSITTLFRNAKWNSYCLGPICQ